jgi:hypothetical protein
MICPHCGFEQPEAAECARCGIVFARYRGRPAIATGPPPLAPGSPAPAAPVFASGASGATAGDLFPGSPGGQVEALPAPAPTLGPSRAGFRSGTALSETFAFYFRNFLPFLVISAVALVPRMLVALPVVRLGAEGAARQSTTALGLTFLALFTEGLGVQFATGAATYGVLQELRGSEVTIAGCLRVGRSAFGRVFAVSFISNLVIGLAALLCLVPGIVLAVRWAVAVPVAVEEAPGAQGALDRSTLLTDGYRWPVFGVVFLVGTLSFGLAVALGVAFVAVPAGTELAAITAALLSTGLAATSRAVMYYRLRSVKESIDVRELASVFD